MDDTLLAAEIESAILDKTHGGVKDLGVEVCDDSVRLTGRCRSFYCKQLAQEAARNGRELVNQIVVE